MKIRGYADCVGHEVVGKLKRVHVEIDNFGGTRKWGHSKLYIDEGGNEYWVGKTGVCIVTADGHVI